MRALFTTKIFFSAVSSISDLLQFVLMILAADLLSPEDFGLFRYTFSLSMVFLAFSDLGMNYLAIRDISRDRSVAPRYVGNILSWKIPLSLVIMGLLIFTSAVVFHEDKKVRIMLAILGSAMTLRFFSLSARSFFQAFERFDLESLGVAVEQFLLVGGGCALLTAGYGVVPLAWLFLATRFVGFLVTFGILNRVVPVSLRFEPRFILKRQIEALPIGIAFGALMAYVHIDTIILDRMTSDAWVGIYNAAYNVYSGFFVIPAIIGTVSLPRLSDTFLRDKPLFHKVVRQNAGAIALLSIPVSIVGILAAGWIIDILYPEDYLPAVIPMRILFVALLVTSQNWLLRLILIATNRQKTFMNIYLAGLVVRAIADVLLIRRFGIVGAAVATLFSELLLFAAMWIAILFGGKRPAPDEVLSAPVEDLARTA